MAKQWIADRHKAYKGKLAAHGLAEQRRQNARASYVAFFDDLKQQVQSDVKEYGETFAGHQECRAIFESAQDCIDGDGKKCVAFTVKRGALQMQVKRTEGTVIINVDYQYTSRSVSDEPPGSIAIEVADQDGTVGYKKNGNFWTDAANVSEVILDKILCG